MGYGNMSKMGSAMDTGPRLTEAQLELSVSEDYNFDLNMGGGANEEQQKQPSEKAEAPKAEVPPKKEGEEGGDDSQEEEEGEDGDEEEFNLFFDRDEIESTKDQQHYDAFEDIKEVKEECLRNGLAGNCELNMIKIENFAPQEEDLLKAGQQSKYANSKKKLKSMKSSHTGDQFEDRKLQDMEADEALELRQKKGADLINQHKEEQSALKKEIEQLLQEGGQVENNATKEEGTERELLSGSKSTKKKKEEALPVKNTATPAPATATPAAKESEEGKNKKGNKSINKKDSSLAVEEQKKGGPSPDKQPPSAASNSKASSAQTESSKVPKAKSKELPAAA